MAKCPATRGGVVDRRGPEPVVIPTYRCGKPAGHKGSHRDFIKRHAWG